MVDRRLHRDQLLEEAAERLEERDMDSGFLGPYDYLTDRQIAHALRQLQESDDE